jgi:hypothetical protein
MPRRIIQNLLFNSGRFIGDRLSVRATAVYALRRVFSTYFGFAIQVRRSSDNGLRNVGFTSSGELDVAALLDFVGAGNGDVMIVYDQSGNGYHQIQESPFRIVSGGALVVVNGRPAMNSNGTASMSVTTPVTSRSQFTFATVAKYTTQAIWSPICGIKDDTSAIARGNPFLQQNGLSATSNALASHNAGLSSLEGNIISVTTPNFLSQRCAFLSRAGGDANGLGGILRLKLSDVAAAAIVTQAFSVSQLSSVFRLGGRQQPGTSPFDGLFQEAWLFTSALSLSDEVLLMADQSVYFAIAIA